MVEIKEKSYTMDRCSYEGNPNHKTKIKFIPYLSFSDPTTLKIVETNASESGVEDILKQTLTKRNVVIRYY